MAKDRKPAAETGEDAAPPPESPTPEELLGFKTSLLALFRREGLRRGILDELVKLGASDPAALTRFLEKTRSRPDAFDDLAGLLRQERKETFLLLERIIAAVLEEPSFDELAMDLLAWRVAPFASGLFRAPSERGRPKKGPIVHFAEGGDDFIVKVLRDVLVTWSGRAASAESPGEIEAFLAAEWYAKRFPYTKGELAARLNADPDSLEDEPLDFWRPLLPYVARALFEIVRRRRKALLERSDERTAGVRPRRLAAWVWLSAKGLPNRAGDVKKLLDRLDKRTAPK